jgi:hypothetical protein
MYTKGILKVFNHPGQYGSLGRLTKIAEDAEFEALSHNGVIWVKESKESWVKTPFLFEDFSNTP